MSHTLNKLSDKQVAKIRSLRKRFVDLETIASAFDVSVSTVHRALKGEGGYSYYVESTTKRGRQAIASMEQIIQVQELRKKGKSYWDISLKTNLSASTVARIVRGEGAYKEVVFYSACTA